MKRFWMMLLTISVVLVIALPAGVAKPGKGPKPPKPPTAVPIAVSLDAEPVWVHEEGDNLRYSVTVDNKTAADLTNVTAYFKADSVTDSAVIPIIPANGAVTIDSFSLLVSESAEAMTCIDNDEDCEVSASVEVHIGDVLITEQTMSTPLFPVPACEFVGGQTVVEDICIWTPTETGVWKITLTPTAPDNRKGPISAVVAVRDGVPGNWCTLADSDSTFTRKWRDGDGEVFGWVYLPSAENGLARDGMCLHGGAGGDYFQVGNPDSFYLRADGTVATEWVGSTP